MRCVNAMMMRDDDGQCVMCDSQCDVMTSCDVMRCDVSMNNERCDDDVMTMCQCDVRMSMNDVMRV